MSEHDEAVAFTQWSMICQHKELCKRRLFAIPNESGKGFRAMKRTMQMNKEGQKKGTSDYLFAHPREFIGGDFYAGLFIELKDFGKYLSKDQKAFILEMRDAGYMAFGVRGWERAAELIDLYINDIGILEPLNEADNLYYGDSKRP